MTGTSLGHYQILEKLGEGGMGVVYKAKDSHLDRFVAIKTLPPDGGANDARRRRFFQEARAASALNHPNIVTIHDISRQDSIDYIVMEFLPGKTIDAILSAGPIRMTDALKYAVQIADALARAHSAGIIHRDLKPGNIMVTTDGLVKVLDFGLAKLTESGGLSQSEETLTAVDLQPQAPKTEQGAIMGTVAYMSPEQAEGRVVDARSDIFSFGIVLYELVTGRRAFQGDSKVSTMAAILSKDPEWPANMPGELRRILQRCLKKDLDRRFQHMSDVKVALLELKEEYESGKSMDPIALAPAMVARPRKWLRAAAVLAAVTLAGAAFYTGRSSAPETIPQWKISPLTSFPGVETQPALSPDGEQVAFAWGRDGNIDVYVMPVAGGGVPLRLTTDEAPDTAPCWSPDGRQVAFIRRGRLMVVPALGGVERRIAQVEGRFQSPAWSPDGAHIAVAAPGVTTVSVANGQAQPLGAALSRPEFDNHVAFSPDGMSIAFTRGTNGFTRSLMVMAISSSGQAQGPPREVIPEKLEFGGLDWSADGKSLVYSVRTGTLDQLYKAGLSGGQAVRLPVDSLSARQPSVSRRGSRMVYARSEFVQNLWRADLNGGEPKPHIASTFSDSAPQFSRDGRFIVFRSTRSGVAGIWRANADGSNQLLLTTVQAQYSGSPRWSPDGQWIAFDSYSDGNSDIYIVSSEGGAARRLNHDPSNESRPSFSADGKWVYFGSDRNGGQNVWKVPAAGGTAVQVTRNGGHESYPSWDGKSVYYAKDAAPFGIWRLPADGGEEALVLPEGSTGNWAMTTGAIYFFHERVLSRYDLATGARKPAHRFGPETPRGGFYPTWLAVSPDEKSLVYVQNDRNEGDLMLVEGFR